MGVGKTTLAKALAETLGAKALIEESGLHPFIKEFYTAPDAYAIETELMFILIHYHQILRELRAGLFKGSVVSDFAFERDYVFATLTLKDKENWYLFEKVYKALSSRIPSQDILIYLEAPIDLLLERIAKRGRDYEKIMTRSFLESVKAALDHYFLKEYQGEIIVFDARDLDSSINPTYISTVISHLQKSFGKPQTALK